MGVIGLEWVVVMGRGTKKVENHWFSATVSIEQLRQEQSVSPYAGQPVSKRKLHICEGSLHTAHFSYCLITVMPIFWLFIKKCCACILEKVKTVFFFGHSLQMVDEIYFR